MPGLTGQSIGRYHIREQLGEGGMATVYKAYDTRLERDVALKVLRTDQFIPAQLQQVLQRFEREAKSLAKLSHSNIVNILDFGEHEGMPFLVMEYLPGGTLKQKLGQPIPWQQAVRLLIPVADGLYYAHRHGIIHRDVKPANILLKETGMPVLTDFGIAKLLETADGQTLTASGVGIGTPEYMAPEQGMGVKTIDARADIYALGIVFYEMVAGRKPYSADTPMAVVLKQISDPLPPPTDFVPGLPASVENVLFKALAKQPDDRYPDMTAMLAAMESLLMEAPTAPVAPMPPVDLKTLESPAPIIAAPTKIAQETAPTRPRFSPKILIFAGSFIAILLLALFVLPLLVRQFPAAPVTTATLETAFINSPAASITPLPPSATPTIAPTETLATTPWPTSTATPLPAWVTDFAEPILASLKNHQPYFEDDFSNNEPKGWFGLWLTDKYGPITIEGGVIRLEEGEMVANSYLRGKTNYAIQVEVSRPVSCCTHIQFRGDGSKLILGPSEWGLCRRRDGTDDCYNSDYSFSQKISVLIFVRDSQAAFYIDGKPVYYYRDNRLATPSAFSESIFFCGGNYCEFDNLKAWNITYLPTPTQVPTSKPTGASSSGPAWVTEFAEPILAYIANRSPTLQDDFEQPSENWVMFSTYHDPNRAKQFKLENGKLLVTDWPVYYRGFQFDDYVVDVDVSYVQGEHQGALGLNFRQNCDFLVTANDMKASCYKIPGGEERIGNIYKLINGPEIGKTTHLRLIVKGSRFAFYVDGEPMGYFEHDLLKTGNAVLRSQGSAAFGAFDNFKVWDITNLKVP